VGPGKRPRCNRLLLNLFLLIDEEKISVFKRSAVSSFSVISPPAPARFICVRLRNWWLSVVARRNKDGSAATGCDFRRGDGSCPQTMASAR
jgi:hypothetical protein